MGGQTLRSQLSRSDPWAGKSCGDISCFPCKEEKGGDCRRKNVGYSITCKECNAEYHGESSRNMYSRGDEHAKGLRNKCQENVLWSHCITCHQGRMVPFRMKATGYFTEPLTRQVNEAVRIFHCARSMNRRGEWKKIAVPRIQFSRE